jgi:chromosome segregation ATPase
VADAGHGSESVEMLKSELDSRLAQQAARIAELESELSGVREQAEQLGRERDEKTRRIGELMTDMLALEKQNREMLSELESLRARQASAAAKLKNLFRK